MPSRSLRQQKPKRSSAENSTNNSTKIPRRNTREIRNMDHRRRPYCTHTIPMNLRQVELQEVSEIGLGDWARRPDSLDDTIATILRSSLVRGVVKMMCQA